MIRKIYYLLNVVLILTLSSCEKNVVTVDKTSEEVQNGNSKNTSQLCIAYNPYVNETTSCNSSSNFVYPECFGAVGDGITDDTQAIRNAISVAATSGKTVVLSEKTYNVSTFDFGDDPNENVGDNIGGVFAFDLPNNITIKGQGSCSVIKIGDNTINIDKYPNSSGNNPRGGSLFHASNKSNINLENFKIDMNGQYNLVKNSAVPDYALLGYAYYGYEVTLSKLTGLYIVDCPGRNAINFRKGQANEVSYSTIRNGGTSIPGNELQKDYSAIYIGSSSTTVKHNRIVHDVYPFYYCGGIETHASYVFCEDNFIEKSFPACYIWADAGETLVRGVTFKRNTIRQSYTGVIIGTENSPNDGVVFNTFRIQDNYFTLTPANFTQFYSNGILAHSYGVFQRGTNNTIHESYIEKNSISFISSGPFNFQTFSIKISKSDILLINENKMFNSSGGALNFVGESGVSGDIKNLYVNKNQVTGFGLNSGPYYHHAFLFLNTKAENIFVTENTITQTFNAANECCYFFEFNNPFQNLTFANDIRININTIKAGSDANGVVVN